MAEEKPKGNPVFLDIPATGETIILPGVSSLNSSDELKAAADAWIAKNYKGPLLAAVQVKRSPAAPSDQTQAAAPTEEISLVANRQPELKAYTPTTITGGVYDALQSGFATLADLIPGFDERRANDYASNILRNIKTGTEGILGIEKTERSAGNILTNRATLEDYFNVGLLAAPVVAKPIARGFRRVAPETSAAIGRFATGPAAVADEIAAAVPETALTPEMAAVATPVAPTPVVPETLVKAKPVETPATVTTPAFQNEIPAPLPEVNIARATVLKNGENSRANLKEWTPKLYRETSPQDLEVFLPTGNVDKNLKDTNLFFADTPDLALGQGQNKGILMEFDASGLSGRLNKSKPAWRLGVENASGSEFIANLNPTGKYRQNLTAVRVARDATFDKVTRERLPRALDKLEQQGWVKTETDQYTQYSRPQATALPEAPVAAAAIPEAAVVPEAVAIPEAVIPEAAVAPKLEVPPAPKVTEEQGRAALLNLEKKDLTNPTTKLPVNKKVADFAADYLTTANLQWDRQVPFIDFFRQHFHADTLPPEMVQDLYKKYDILQEEDWMEIMTGVRQTVGDAGRTLAYLRGASNKIPEGAVDIAQKFNKEVPPPSLWTRSGNALRGSFITEAGKVTRDILGSLINGPLDVVTNVADNALNQVLLNPVRSVVGRPTRDINYGDAFVLFSQGLAALPSRTARALPFGLAEKAEKLVPSKLRSIEAQNRKLFDQLARNAPKVSRDFLDTYSADNVRPALSDKFAKVEKAIDATNFLGRWADGMTRKAIFPAFLRRATSRAGFNFDEMVANQTIHTVPQEVIEKALNDTAQFVFARKAGKGGPMFLGENAKKVIDLINNQGGPVGAVTVGYPGFIANALNFQYRYGPGMLSALTKKGREKVMSGDTAVLSEGIMGLAMVYAAMQFQKSEYAGSKWYTAKMPDGTEKDLRPVFPMPYYLLLGDLINRYNDDTLDQAYSSADILQGLSGAQFRAGAGLYVADELMRDLTRAGTLGDKAMDAIKKTLGSAIGGIIPYGGTVKDIVAQANPEEAIVRDTSEAPFLGAALREVPFAQTRLLNLPEQEYASKAGPAQTVDPLLRQVTGLATSKPANIIEREMRSLGLDERDLYQKEGFSALDRRQRQVMGDYAEYNAPEYFNSPEYRNADKLTQTEMFREFYKGIRKAAREAVKNENENFTALIWFNDQSREDKIRLDRDYMKSVGKPFQEYYAQLVKAPIPANKKAFDALPVGAQYTDPGDYKVYTKGK